MDESLHDYQDDAIRRIEGQHKQVRRTLLSLPTGTGKTLVAATYAKRHFVDRNQTVLWIAHTEELLTQAYKCFARLGIREHRIARRYAGLDEFEAKPRAVVFLVNNQGQTGPDTADLLVVDEAHHAAGISYTEWLSLYKTYRDDGTKVLGLTATPYRLQDGEVTSLLAFKYSNPRVPIFESIAYQKSFCDLATMGRVAPYMLETIPTKMTFSMRLRNGDFASESLEDLNTPKRNNLIVQLWQRNRAKYRKTLIFVGTQNHAQDLAKAFGDVADYVVSDQERDDRRSVIDRFKNGSLQVLVNVRMLGEGVDVPDIRTVILARPTTSPILFVQMVGRGSRITNHKKFFHLVDIHDQLGKHDDYLAGVEELADRGPDAIATALKRAIAQEEAAKAESFQVGQRGEVHSGTSQVGPSASASPITQGRSECIECGATLSKQEPETTRCRACADRCLPESDKSATANPPIQVDTPSQNDDSSSRPDIATVPPDPQALSVVDREMRDEVAEGAPAAPAHAVRSQAEKDAIIAALSRANGNIASAALDLGCSRRTLQNRMREYGLPRGKSGRPRRRIRRRYTAWQRGGFVVGALALLTIVALALYRAQLFR